MIRQHRNEVDQAVKCYSKALQIDPKLITAWINLTSAYTMLEEDVKAVDAARQAVTLEPDCLWPATIWPWPSISRVTLPSPSATWKKP